MTPEERARAAVEQYRSILTLTDWHLDDIVAKTTAAICAAEAEMKERCAKVADAAADRNWNGSGERTAPEDIAADIRALDEQKSSPT